MVDLKKNVEEDAPANSVAGGGVAGVNSGDTVVRKKKDKPAVIKRSHMEREVTGDAVIKREDRAFPKFKEFIKK